MFRKYYWLFLSLLLTGCFHMYRPTIQQGNSVSPDMVQKLKLGMSAEQVRYLLGTPLLDNSFNPNRWDYVYTIKPGNGPFQLKRTTLYFQNDRLARVESTSP